MFKNKKVKTIEEGLDKKEVASRSKAILGDDTTFVANESYKASRTNIIFTVPNDSGCNIIMFTSSVPGEGKTTTCVNTAISFGQTGAKVLLIEADMRRPKVCECLDFEIKEGLSNVLGGFSKTEDVIKRLDKYPIDIMVAGWIPPNPTELLASKKIKEVLDAVRDKYDYIFIDTPPVNTVTDAVLLTKHVDGVIVVVRSKYTAKPALRKAVKALEFSNAKIMGFIVNDSAVARKYSRYRGYRKYGYYRKYGDYYQRSAKQTPYEEEKESAGKADKK